MSRPRHVNGLLLAMSVLLIVLMLAPPIRQWLEASMTAQMLIQMPLLIAIGCLLARAVPTSVLARIAPWNQLGITGLVLISVVSIVWMLPRVLDASVTYPWITAAKFLSLPLLIGLPLALSWPSMNFIVRGVFLLELIATLLRLGWLYLISPERLCNLYLLDDQQRLGKYLLMLAGVLLLSIAGKLLWGRFDQPPSDQPSSSAPNRL